jgi:hypothetical protein
MSEAIPLEPVEISSAVPDGSGALTWTVADARAIQLHSAEKNIPETSGIVAEEKIFLVFAENSPHAGDRIRWRGEDFDIRSVRIFHSFSGKIIAYRCVC